MGKKNTTKIRVYQEDARKWGDYCKMTRGPSAELFNKIMKSEKLKLDKKIQEEALKEEQRILRRLGKI